MRNQVQEFNINRSVEVNRKQLIETLKSNRETHVAEYEEAVKGYKEMAMQKLEEAYDEASVNLDKYYEKAQNKINKFDPENPTLTEDYIKLVEGVTVELRVPRNYAKAYDTAIDMAEWDVNETLTLSAKEFQQFVKDNWDWTEEFNVTKALYFSK